MVLHAQLFLTQLRMLIGASHCKKAFNQSIITEELFYSTDCFVPLYRFSFLFCTACTTGDQSDWDQFNSGLVRFDVHYHRCRRICNQSCHSMPAPVQLNMLEVIYIRLSPYIILVPCTFLQLMNNEIIERQVKETMPKKKTLLHLYDCKKTPKCNF